jgi:hypothetical protein
VDEYGVASIDAMRFIERYGSKAIPHDELVKARQQCANDDKPFAVVRDAILAPYFLPRYRDLEK